MTIILRLAAFGLVALAAGAAFAGTPGPSPGTPVPEPATLTLIAAGIGGLAVAKFRGRK